MSVYQPKWLDWSPADQSQGVISTPPKKAQVGTDKTDKSPLSPLTPPFVSSVSSSPGRFRGGRKEPLALHEGAQITKNAPLSLTDKTDKRSERTLWEEPDKPDKSPPGTRIVLLAVPDLSDPEDIRVWLDERAAMREDSGTARADAEKVAFDQLLWLWCEANPSQHTSGQCAACGTPFGAPVMSLPDGSQVCEKPDHACLISYGNGRRMTAVRALKGLEIEPPRWWEL